MGEEKRGLGIIFHSGVYDRVYHRLSIALAASASGKDVKLFFTYWALEYLKKKNPNVNRLDKEAKEHEEILEKSKKRGHLTPISESINLAEAMGAKFYVYTSSMSLLNIARNKLCEEVGKTMGTTTFLAEVNSDQIIFI